jgi:hypothetical protein
MIFIESINMISDICVIIVIRSCFRDYASYVSSVIIVHMIAPELIAIKAADDGAECAQANNIRRSSAEQAYLA